MILASETITAAAGASDEAAAAEPTGAGGDDEAPVPSPRRPHYHLSGALGIRAQAASPEAVPAHTALSRAAWRRP